MLDLFQTIGGLSEEELHPKFKFLREVQRDGERKILASWTKGFTDRDNKIVKEFQTTFHSSFWELYLHHLFQEFNFQIDYTKNRPDFIIRAPYRINIEAVVSNIKLNGRNESSRDADDILSMLDPPHLQKDFNENLDEAITRYSNAILSKYSKLVSQYSKLDWIESNIPFMLALGSFAQINYGREFYYPLIALLFGQYYYPVERKYYLRESIDKPGTNQKIKIGLFNDPSMENISAIIFSCTVTIGKLTSLSRSINNSELNRNDVLIIREEFEPPYYWFQNVDENDPEQHSDGLFIFHNPNARNKLSTDIFAKSCATQISISDDEIIFEGWRPPIFSRISLPMELLRDNLKGQLITDTFNRFNFT